MAVKYVNAKVLDGGLNYIKGNANEMWLLSDYTLLDSYATVSGKKICSVTMDTVDPTTDYSITGADGAARVLAIAGKSGTATGSSVQGTNDLHIALVDTVNSEVLVVTDETSNQSVSSGNTINFPSLTYTSSQPS